MSVLNYFIRRMQGLAIFKTKFIPVSKISLFVISMPAVGSILRLFRKTACTYCRNSFPSCHRL